MITDGKMDITSFLTTVLTSTVVTGLIIFLLKSYFKTRIEHHFQIELEKYKSELIMRLNLEHDISSRRLEAYPKIVELIYRTRNMARDLESNTLQMSPSLVEEFAARAKELAECLYKFRIDLERDEMFSDIHRYKNTLRNFNWRISDIRFFLEHGEEEKANLTGRELSSIFKDIEEHHKKIIHDLSQYNIKLAKQNK